MYPNALWNFNRSDKVLYLTFDDGPIPELTDWVLEELKKYQAKATFFCVGANIEKHPELFARILSEGHQAGNHTMFHTKGFHTSTEAYLKEAAECRQLVKSALFRPPYGKMTHAQYKGLLKQGYQVVMWDVISYDYEKISPEECFQKVKNNCKNGSIVLFHDNIKATDNMKHALSETLLYFSGLGYRFEAIALD